MLRYYPTITGNREIFRRIRMDSQEMEQKFDAIYMAIVHGHITAARCAFRMSIQIAIDEKLDQIIDFLEKEDMSCSLQELEDFRSDQMTKTCSY